MKKILTDEMMKGLTPIEYFTYPKPIKPPKKTMRDYALYAGIKKVLKSRQAIKDRIAKYHTTSVKVGRKHKKRLPSISSLKKKADAVFSIFIRNRDGNKCVLCNSTDRVQCGHLIKRGKMATRYDETNCHALCSSCNYKDNFEPWHYACWFIFENSDIAYQALINKSRGIKQMKRIDYEGIIKKYGSNDK